MKNCRKRILKLLNSGLFSCYLAVALGVSVLGIYGYSMYAVKQEKFLDDFEEPAKEELTQKQL